ncbi:hypothetical protein ABIC50_002280 [Burkholderia sp. 567]
MTVSYVFPFMPRYGSMLKVRRAFMRGFCRSTARVQPATEGWQMLINSTRFRIDPTPRRADGEFIAHARIITILEDGDEREVHVSGDLAGFDVRDDAVAYATKWVEEWLAAQFG